MDAAALLVALMLGALLVAGRGLSAFWTLKKEVADSTRVSVFQGSYAEGRDVMAVLESAKLFCELSPLDEHGRVEVSVRSKDAPKARSALASKV